MCSSSPISIASGSSIWAITPGWKQQGVAIDDFDRRRDQRFWRDLVAGIPQWDRLIEEFNAEVGAPRAH